MDSVSEYARALGENAKSAARILRMAPARQRNAALSALAKILLQDQAAILAANDQDVAEAKNQGLSGAMVDRLLLNPQRLQAVAKGVRDIVKLPDPVGRVLEKRRRRDGLRISRVSVPIGTVLFIFESRPNVTIDGAALCVKSGNAVILRGGKEAAHTNAAFAVCIRKALAVIALDGESHWMEGVQLLAVYVILALAFYFLPG
jgi:glutamate-5-semialdehyde dehydrogenase